MLTKQQLVSLGVFRKDLFASLTFKQIKEESKQKSNNIVQIALKKFKEQELVKTKVTGDVTTYSLNFDNNLTLSYLNLINEKEISKKKFPKEILSGIQKKISKQTNFFILIVFGSYTKNKATEKSDLDVAVIVESEQTRKEIAPFLETVKRREIKPIDYHIFTRNEFLEMLKTDIENVGKQIYKNSIIYYGFIEYYNLILGRKNE
ncbi:TPA: nucleotidyltransferase domain-containing protein [Candidatus Woesearchaeota archaeon]|nr:nucleotidyltransferase domain-containing protein [Candidatus Woesearchaeota archaeon]